MSRPALPIDGDTSNSGLRFAGIWLGCSALTFALTFLFVGPSTGVTGNWPASRTSARRRLFEVIGATLGHYLRSDGVVANVEIDRLEQTIEQEIATLADRDVILDYVAWGFDRALDDRISLDHLWRAIETPAVQALLRRPPIDETLVHWFGVVGLADGFLCEYEQAFVSEVMTRLGWPQDRIDRRLAPFKPDVLFEHESSDEIDPERLAEMQRDREAYQRLGLTYRCPWPQVRDRFRELAKEYHPDSLASADVSQPIQALVADRFAKISEAYEHLRRKHSGQPASNAHARAD